MRKKALFALVLALCVCAAAFAEDTAQTMRITIPPGFDPAKTTVVVAQYAEGLNLAQAKWDKVAKQFTVPLVSQVKSAKVLMYYPGHKILATEIAPDKLAQPFAATFEELPTVPLTIQLTGSDGQPIGGQVISLRQSPVDMPYFNYSDGMVVGDRTAPVASGTSDADGKLTVRVPLLLNDPLYAKLNVPPAFNVSSNWQSPTGMNDYDLVPNSIDARKAYPDVIQIRLIYRSTICGIVPQSFLSKHQITAKLGPDEKGSYKVWFEVDAANGKSGQGAGVAADGSFSVSEAPGTYNLSIQVRDEQGFVTKSVRVANSFVLGENETKTIDFAAL